MSKNIVLYACILLLAVEHAASIECYSCISTENPDCVEPEKHLIEKRKCDSDGLRKTKDYASNLNNEFREIFDVQISEYAIPLNCLKQVVKVRGDEIVLRGCQLPKDSQNHLDVCRKVFEMPYKSNVHVMHCSLCDTDGCNASAIIRVSQFFFIVALFTSLL